jgi:hypothetical protein
MVSYRAVLHGTNAGRKRFLHMKYDGAARSTVTRKGLGNRRPAGTALPVLNNIIYYIALIIQYLQHTALQHTHYTVLVYDTHTYIIILQYDTQDL